MTDDNDPAMPDSSGIFEKPVTYQQFHAELNLPQGEFMLTVKVFSRSKDENGDLKGLHGPNTFLNTLIRDVEFPDDDVNECSSNVIAENVFSQADGDGHAMKVLDAIVDFRKDRDVIDKADMHLRTKSRQKCLRHTTSGQSLLITQKNGEEE